MPIGSIKDDVVRIECSLPFGTNPNSRSYGNLREQGSGSS